MQNLGRRVSVDDRDRNFLLRRKLPPPGTTMPTRKTWAINAKSLDQGGTSTCIGHAWKNFLRCAPMQTVKSGPTPWDIYRGAVAVDEWSDNDDEASLPDGDPGMDSGTSVRAGAEAVLKAGRLKTYLWAFDLQSLIQWVLTQGPAVLGIDWYSSFNTPNAEGIIKITPMARVEGGHAILCRGIDLTRSLALLTNSWGDGYGISGEVRIPLTDLERLLHQQGDCCTASEQKLSPRVA